MEATGDGGKNVASCIIFKRVVNQTLKTMLFPDGHCLSLPFMFSPLASNTLPRLLCTYQYQTEILGTHWD